MYSLLFKYELKTSTSERRVALSFEKEYFRDLKYPQKERVIRAHVLDSLKWGSRVCNSNLLDGNGKTALDVGCAYGYAVDILNSFGYESCGVDISWYSLKEARQFRSSDFLVCDVQDSLPFKEETFDLLTCFGVLEHLVNPFQALENMTSVCKRVLICTTPNRLVEKPIKRVIGDYDKTHINVKTRQEWGRYIESLNPSFFKVEPFLDASLRATDRLLFFKSFKMPYLGLDLRILIKK